MGVVIWFADDPEVEATMGMLSSGLPLTVKLKSRVIWYTVAHEVETTMGM